MQCHVWDPSRAGGQLQLHWKFEARLLYEAVLKILKKRERRDRPLPCLQGVCWCSGVKGGFLVLFPGRELSRSLRDSVDEKKAMSSLWMPYLLPLVSVLLWHVWVTQKPGPKFSRTLYKWLDCPQPFVFLSVLYFHPKRKRKARMVFLENPFSAVTCEQQSRVLRSGQESLDSWFSLVWHPSRWSLLGSWGVSLEIPLENSSSTCFMPDFRVHQSNWWESDGCPT